MVKYSICITNYNMKNTINPFMESVLNQIDSDFEVVVCDNFSDDGSREILEEYAKKGHIKLIVEHSSRGKGRQIAFENSNGEYIISGLDTDDVVKPTLKDVLKLYHAEHEGYALSFGTIHFIHRQLVEAVNGWRDLQWAEDVDFCKRIESIGKMHYFHDDSVIIERRGHTNRGFAYKLKEEYRCCQSKYQVGLSLFRAPTTWYYRPIQFTVALSALVVSKIKHTKRYKYN